MFKKLLNKIMLLLLITLPFQSIAISDTIALQGDNLFDKSKVIVDKYINWNTGQLADNTIYTTSDYIEVQANQHYTNNKFSRVNAYYDANKEFIAAIENPQSTIIIPNNVKYVRFSFYKSDIDTLQFQMGYVSTPYEPYEGISSEDDFLLFLPNEICVAVGRTIELYNNQVAWNGNIDNYHFKWESQVGMGLKRKFSVTGTFETIGEYPLTLTVYDNNMKQVAAQTATIKIVSNVIINSQNILTIGDSLSNSKPWLSELRLLSSNKFNLVGTRGYESIQHEARSGWSAANYLTGDNYTFENEGPTPFWDGTRFNWNYYKNQTGINPDAVQIFLGTNGIELDPTLNATNIKQIVDYIRQDDTNLPIFVTYTIYKGNQDGIGKESKGRWKLEEDRKVFNLMSKLNELLKDYPNLHFVPISVAHDSEYNFGAVLTPVNPRSMQVELQPIEATHPQEQGYLQMADIIFSVLAKHLND